MVSLKSKRGNLAASRKLLEEKIREKKKLLMKLTLAFLAGLVVGAFVFGRDE